MWKKVKALLDTCVVKWNFDFIEEQNTQRVIIVSRVLSLMFLVFAPKFLIKTDVGNTQAHFVFM